MVYSEVCEKKYELWINDKNIVKIIGRALDRYSKIIEREEIWQVGRISLFTALRTYNQEKFSHIELPFYFRTIFYNNLNSIYKKTVQYNKFLRGQKEVLRIRKEGYFHQDFAQIENFDLDFLKKRDKSILEARFKENLSFSELSAQFGVSISRIQQLISKNLKKIKEKEYS